MQEDGYERFLPPGSSTLTPSSQLQPPMVLCEELICLYFRYIHVSFHVLFHEPSFQTAFRSGTLPKILLFAVFGMSARFSQHESLASIPPRERGRPFTKEAERLLNLHDVSLTTIQACLLLGASAVAEGGGAIESVFFSVACRMGLLLDLPNAPVATRIQQEVNYRGDDRPILLTGDAKTDIVSVVDIIRDGYLVIHCKSTTEDDAIMQHSPTYGRETISGASHY